MEYGTAAAQVAAEASTASRMVKKRVVVVVMIRPNQLNGAVRNAETLDTTRVRAKRVKNLLLNLMQGFCTRI